MQTEGNETNQPETTEPSQPEQGLTVERLRQQMSAENKTFAVAYLGYMTYDYETVWEFIDILAIVDGQLVLRNYFEFDGAPSVSYETFQRVG